MKTLFGYKRKSMLWHFTDKNGNYGRIELHEFIPRSILGITLPLKVFFKVRVINYIEKHDFVSNKYKSRNLAMLYINNYTKGKNVYLKVESKG